MGPPPNPDAMLEMMDNPMFLSQMNEAMNNPAVVDMMMQSPMVSGGATEWFLLADT
jgi:ubiquilin